MSGKIVIIFLGIVSISCLFLLIGCGDRSSDSTEPEIASANSYISAAIKDLCGKEQQILSLVPPGMCPGHFDISPSQVSRLRNCKILLAFDFQQNFGENIKRINDRGLEFHTVTPAPGLCIPETYVSITKQIAATLSEQNPSRKANYESKLAEIETRMEQLGKELSEDIELSGLKNTKVIASQHQAEFARWLGLDVMGTFLNSDAETPKNLNQLLQDTTGDSIRFVIANKQEGTALASALAERLEAQLVIFGNFPESDDEQDNLPAFDSLLRKNIRALSGATEK
ncbi:MAG: zinc ABC transporter substrate-binding protein [Sedimentisphaerales bacterium]|nr:zinc ABC transporter substrate-binding protein [Sedimentisphaerales bacterium]